MDNARAVLEGVTGGSVIAGNAIEVFRNGDEIFPAMLETIETAERTVDMLTYVYWTGDIARRMADALAKRAADGLRVRVILDAIGSMSMDDGVVEKMIDAGCVVERFRTPDDRPTRMHHRTHRKLLIADEQVAMTGGVGIAAEWEGNARNPDEWRDTHFRITGPAVRHMSAAFIEHWVECGHPTFTDQDLFPELALAGPADVLVLRGSSGPFWHEVGLAMDALLRGARAQIHLTTAYFAPGDRMVGLLCQAAERGVEVQLLLPGTHMDKRVVQLASADEYERLLDCGVQICHYEQTMLHAKTLTIDAQVALIGSANIDERSMRHNEEIALAVFDASLVSLLDDHFRQDMELSEPINLERWNDRSAWRKLVESVVDPIEEWL